MGTLLLCAVLLVGGCTTVGKSVPGIENFSTADGGDGVIFRGGQPSRAGIDLLRRMGVKTVINLRDEQEQWEAEAVNAAGMAYIVIPSDPSHADPKRVEEFLRVVQNADWPIFVHCRRGRDRTGLQIAAYRIVEQGWSREAAIKELRDHGHCWLFFPDIEHFLKTFDSAAMSRPSRAEPGGVELQRSVDSLK